MEEATHQATIPLKVHIALMLHAVIIPFGVFFFLFGSMFMFLFEIPMGIKYLPLTLGMPTGTTSGHMRSYTITGATENKQPIYRLEYDYTVNGKKYINTAYETATNQYIVKTDDWNPREYPVIYVLSSPELSTIRGMRPTSVPWFAMLLILIFPTVGLTFIYFGLKGHTTKLRILRNARRATGKVISIKASNIEINHQPLMNVTLLLTNAFGETSEVVVQTLTPSLLTDSPQEALIYNDQNVKETLAIDDQPKVVKEWIAENV
jgi:hypothetical protein